MINEEFFKDKINTMEKIAINKESMEPMECYRNLLAKCSNCFRDDKAQCSDRKLLEWLRMEHKEYPVLTKYQHIFLIVALENYNFLARSKNGWLTFYEDKPEKKNDTWSSVKGGYCLGSAFDRFEFVKWEDENPWSIRDLLDNCEVEE